MTHKILLAIVFTMASGLAACGVGPGLTGNSTGGIIAWSPENQEVAREWAAQHCARYGKVAEMHRPYPRYGEYISFTCQFPSDGYSFRYSR
jgi:hypothetical protein